MTARPGGNPMTQPDLAQVGADYAEKHEWYVNHVGGIAEVPLDELGRLAVRDGGISEERLAAALHETMLESTSDVHVHSLHVEDARNLLAALGADAAESVPGEGGCLDVSPALAQEAAAMTVAAVREAIDNDPARRAHVDAIKDELRHNHHPEDPCENEPH